MDNNESMKKEDIGELQVLLPAVFIVSFKSGHSKKIIGRRVEQEGGWVHFVKTGGLHIHVNKNEVEYIDQVPFT